VNRNIKEKKILKSQWVDLSTERIKKLGKNGATRGNTTKTMKKGALRLEEFF